MASPTYRDLFPDETVERLTDEVSELEVMMPKTKEFILLWLREKAKRAKVQNSPKELPLYRSAVLADNIAQAIRGEVFPDFDVQYMDFLYRSCTRNNFSLNSLLRLSEYLNEKQSLFELSRLSEHLLDNEMIDAVMNILREEPKEEWYENIIADCEDSVLVRKYYASVFGVNENEVLPISEVIKDLKQGDMLRVVLGEGAPEETIAYVKAVKDKKGLPMHIFAHEALDNKGLEYFTVGVNEGKFIPIVKENALSGLENIILMIKQSVDFSDSVYLDKPSVEDISERYEAAKISNPNEFMKSIDKIFKAMEKNKRWSLGQGNVGKTMASAPAYAKFKVLRMRMTQFELTGEFSMSAKKALEMAQEEDRLQQDFIVSVFSSMREFANIQTMAIQETGNERTETNEPKVSKQPEQDVKKQTAEL